MSTINSRSLPIDGGTAPSSASDAVGGRPPPNLPPQAGGGSRRLNHPRKRKDRGALTCPRKRENRGALTCPRKREDRVASGRIVCANLRRLRGGRIALLAGEDRVLSIPASGKLQWFRKREATVIPQARGASCRCSLPRERMRSGGGLGRGSNCLQPQPPSPQPHLSTCGAARPLADRARRAFRYSR